MAISSLRQITDEEITSFNRDGAVLLKSVLDGHWTEILAEGLEFTQAHPDGMSAGVDMALRIDQFPASHSPR